MPILALGVSHHETPVDVRERLAIPADQLPDALARLTSYVPSGVILSTCNRTEIYASVGHRTSGQRALTRFLADISGVAEPFLQCHLRVYWQEDAVRHLFRVAAGLESMIVGEGQILGQVREAFETATRGGPLGPELSRLFSSALAVGKRARTETAISRSAVSVSQAAVELAYQVLGRLGDTTVLVIGAGKMGELAARHLRDKGVGRILVSTRTAERAERLVERLGGEAWPLERLGDALLLADLVVSSTTSEQYVITRALLEPLLARRDGRPLVVVDIAVPRDVEPSVGELRNVHLYNVDHLRDICAANLDQRRRESDKIAAIIDEELQKYVRWWQAREVVPTIAALVRKAEAIRQDELNRAYSRLGALSERDRNTVNALTLAIMNKLLHEPIVRLKERGAALDGQHYLHAVRELFDLPPNELAVE